MIITPLGKNLLLKPVTAQDNLQGGLVIPDSVHQDRPDMGEVIEKGPDATLEPGTKVIYNRYAPDEILKDGEKMLLISQDDILATYA